MGGSSGGGGSGKVDYPDYMKTVHNDWLDNTGVDTITSSITDVMSAALGNSPWTGQIAYDPDADVAAWENVIAAFATVLAGMDDIVDWAAFYTQAETSVPDITEASGITEAVIVADVDAFADQLDDEITTKVLPRFRRGMQDINTVTSSAFAIGTSIIEGFRDREVAKHNSTVRLNAMSKNADINIANQRLHSEVKSLRLSATEQMLKLMLQRVSFEEVYMKTFIEAKRIKIVAKKEENEVEMDIDDRDAKWDLEVFQYGGNLLSSIGGGTVATQKASKPQSALGGALSGAAAGAMVGSAVPGIGTAIGAGVGGILGAASAFL